MRNELFRFHSKTGRRIGTQLGELLGCLNRAWHSIPFDRFETESGEETRCCRRQQIHRFDPTILGVLYKLSCEYRSVSLPAYRFLVDYRAKQRVRSVTFESTNPDPLGAVTDNEQLRFLYPLDRQIVRSEEPLDGRQFVWPNPL